MNPTGKSLFSRACPFIDLALIIAFVYFSPAITNWVSPLFGWATGPDFNIFEVITYLAWTAVIAAPFVLNFVGFYSRQNLQRPITAARQLLTFAAYYLCIIAIYQSLGNHSLFYNHVIMVNIVGVPLVLFVRFFLSRAWARHISTDKDKLRQIILAGTEENIEAGWNSLPAYWRANFNVVGKAVTGTYSEEELAHLIVDNSVAHLFVFGGLSSYGQNATAIHLAESLGLDIYIARAKDASNHMRVEVHDVEGKAHILSLSFTPEYSFPLVLKGIFDRVAALLGIICSSPLWLVAAIGIKISDPAGKVFYRQQRSGLYGKPFGMWKFRSMYSDADQRLEEVKAKYGNEMDGPIFKLTNDPRIFPFGHFIRRTSIDELPQLINILCGDMSVVGPRPLPTYETDEFPDIAHRRRLSVKPGLTCYWQVEDRSDSEESYRNMITKDLKYIDNWSLWVDIKLILRTIPAVLMSKGAK
ncbi:MAG: sugar transferase [Akkermansia sp.]|nr:sugar transferase [Akkermansia sp.]